MTIADAAPDASAPPKAKAKAKPRKQAADPAAAPLSQFQAGQTQVIHRGQLKNAPYNPRTISGEAKRRLKEEIKRHGYLDRVVWNTRTGHIVRGHQRLACLDALEGTQDYRLEVTAVDLDEAAEKEANVSGNNPGLTGEYDLEALGKLFREDKVDFEAAGFSTDEVYGLFGSNPLEDQAEHLAKMADQLRALRENHDAMTQKIAEDNSTSFYCVVVFKNHGDRKRFMEGLGLPDARYLDSRLLTARLGGAASDEAVQEEPALELPEE